MKRNLSHYDTSSSIEETTTTTIVSSSSSSSSSTCSSSSNESSTSHTTETSSQETTSTASILTPSYISSNTPSILYQHKRLLYLTKQPSYYNNYNNMTISKEKSKSNDNESVLTSSSTPSSVSVKQYKNSPFGLTGHYLTMPDSNVHSSAIMLNHQRDLDSDSSNESFGLAGGADNEDDDTPIEEHAHHHNYNARNHKHAHYNHNHQQGLKNQTRLSHGTNKHSSGFVKSATNNMNWSANKKHTIPHLDEQSCNDIDLIGANNKHELNSPTNSFTQLENHHHHHVDSKTPWLLDYHHHHHHHVDNNNKHQLQAPLSSQPKSVHHIHHHSSSLYQDDNHLAGNLSPAGDAGLDAKKCNAKDIEKSDCFDIACHPSKSSSTTTVAYEAHLQQKKQLGQQHESSSLLVRFSSIMYATFLVILGCILHVSELRQKSKNSSDHIYTTIVALIGIAWLLFLQMDLQRYKRYASKYILIETIFNDHKQKQKLKRREELALSGVIDPSARSTTSSSASLVNDRMSMNTEVIFKKTAYKMYQRRAALEHHRHIQNQNKHHTYKSPIGIGIEGAPGKARKITSKSSVSSLNSHHHYLNANNHNYHNYRSDMYKSRKASSLVDGSSSSVNSDRDNLIPAYKFLHGKMGANFYLKCGMAAFCFGHVIHEGLRFGQQAYFFGDGNVHCRDSAALIAHLITPLYSFYQLFMMFKYSNVSCLYSLFF